MKFTMRKGLITKVDIEDSFENLVIGKYGGVIFIGNREEIISVDEDVSVKCKEGNFTVKRLLELKELTDISLLFEGKYEYIPYLYRNVCLSFDNAKKSYYIVAIRDNLHLLNVDIYKKLRGAVSISVKLGTTQVNNKYYMYITSSFNKSIAEDLFSFLRKELQLGTTQVNNKY